MVEVVEVTLYAKVNSEYSANYLKEDALKNPRNAAKMISTVLDYIHQHIYGDLIFLYSDPKGVFQSIAENGNTDFEIVGIETDIKIAGEIRPGGDKFIDILEEKLQKIGVVLDRAPLEEVGFIKPKSKDLEGEINEGQS